MAKRNANFCNKRGDIIKTLLVIIDGATDEASKALDGLTPLEYGDYENLRYLHQNGLSKTIDLCPSGLSVDSMVCILTLLGFAPDEIPIGRCFLEALGSGLKTNPQDVIFRCNITEVINDFIVSSCPACFSDDLICDVIYKINQKTSRLGLTLVHTGGYKILLICTGMANNMSYVTTYPPHQNIGKPIHSIENKVLNELIDISNAVLIEYKQGQSSFKLVPWDYSVDTKLKSFESIHKKLGAVVCGATIMSGIGKALGMEVVVPKNATADSDTSLTEKAVATLPLLKHYPYVLCHINGADECSHRKDPVAKAKFLKQIDRIFLGEVLENLPYDTELIVCSDHCSSSTTGKHFAGLQPYISYKKR